MPNSVTFTNKIAALAKSRGRSQASLARHVAMQPAHLNHFLKGHGDVHSASLVKILAELGVDLNAILEKEIARASGGEATEKMDGGEVFTSLVAAMADEDRRAFLGYAMKFARESLGAPAQAKIRRLRSMW